METVLFEGAQISKLPNIWDEQPEDYVIFITTMLGAISYPFWAEAVAAKGSHAPV